MSTDGDEVVALANALEKVCHGHQAAHVYMAIGMLIGAGHARAAEPDLDGLHVLLELIGNVAFDEFDAELKARGNG